MAADSTVASFPTYADLTLTQGWARDATMPVALQDTLDIAEGRYKEGQVLGVGGMGKVVLAHDARIGRDVAIKQLHGDRELAPEERARFLREARVQGQLEHPAIVPVYDIEHRPDGTTFFTMRRVLGRTLHAIIDDLRKGDAAAVARYTQRELLTAFATVCLTIDYAHSRGVIHRDLKPANIMLGDFGEVYVLDWGLARIVHESPRAPSLDEPPQRLSSPGEMMGTPLYMAPEQMADPEVGPAADVFALGAILFELLTYERLRDARSLYQPVEARPSVRCPDKDIAPELEMLCAISTEADPDDRYPSARALYEALVRYMEGDRQIVQRKDLAADHVRGAREALERAEQPGANYEQERTIAMRELQSAMMLDPTDPEIAEALHELIATPPRVMPPEVRDAMRAEEQQLVRSGMMHSAIASACWFVFFPLVLAMGLLSAGQAAMILVPVGISAVIAAFGSRRRIIPMWLQLAVIVPTLFGMAATSRLMGPLVLVPTMLTALTVVLQVHPSSRMRLVTAILGVVTLIAPVVLEAVGLLPASYLFAAGRVEIVPQLAELPGTLTILLVLLASAAALVIPTMFISRLRRTLAKAQQRLLVQAWHFRRLTAT